MNTRNHIAKLHINSGFSYFNGKKKNLVHIEDINMD